MRFFLFILTHTRIIMTQMGVYKCLSWEYCNTKFINFVSRMTEGEYKVYNYIYERSSQLSSTTLLKYAPLLKIMN